MEYQTRKLDSVEVSAMAVVVCNGKILATVENIYGKLALSLPKGHQEVGETLLQTAIRECFEETNVVVTQQNLVKQLKSYSYEFSTPSGKFVRKTIAPFLFMVDNQGQAIAKEERMISVQWMSVEEFLAKCTYDNVKSVVKSINL